MAYPFTLRQKTNKPPKPCGGLFGLEIEEVNGRYEMTLTGALAEEGIETKIIVRKSDVREYDDPPPKPRHLRLVLGPEDKGAA